MNNWFYSGLRWFVVLLWSALPLSYAWASIVPLADINNEVPVSTYFSSLTDESGHLTIDQVMARSDEFGSPSSGTNPHLWFKPNIVWLKLTLTSRARTEKDWVLDFKYSYMENMTAYLLSNGDIKVQRNGFSVPPANRVILNATPSFELHLHANETITVYIRVERFGRGSLDATIQPLHQFIERSNKHLLIQAIYLGMVFSLCVYNLFLGVVLKQKPFISYVGFIGLLGFTNFIAIGTGSLYFWPLITTSANHIIPAGYILSMALSFIFARHYMQTKEYAPLTDSLLKWGSLFYFAATLGVFFLPVSYAMFSLTLFGILNALVMLIFGFDSIHCHVPSAKFFFTAWICTNIGILLVVLRQTGWIGSNFMTFYGLQLGSVIEMLMLTFGLATKFNELKQQKEEAQQLLVDTLRMQEAALEKRVALRTAELESAREEMERLATLDPLTRVLNRHGLRLYLTALNEHADDQPHILSVVFVDLDYFKPINDRHGHAMGDYMLKVIAQRLQGCAGQNDVIARYGGDEFVILSKRFTRPQQLKNFGQRVRDTLTTPVVLPNGVEVSIGVSVGMSAGSIRETDAKSLLKQADSAMYQIKHDDTRTISTSQVIWHTDKAQTLSPSLPNEAQPNPE